MTDQDKRKHSRIDSLNLLSYVCLDEEGGESDQGVARTLNISQGGILIETHIPIKSQYVMLIEIGMEDQLINIKGKVVHSKENEDNMFENGITFLETDTHAHKIINDLVNAFNTEDA